ncbi:hypothetical protein KDK95_13500 [Actinospica sp. MGRD01-02]|uniref:Uncharacterized protein n=1 Tax=Actinospica acidithermotolerans TaxID=2828514 RepID=A0A941EA07_9ACTN|nr:hypothetical protein [Actinospica acidithermotolerans]MBR7827327.1 hypothetical protein [Actinospica acidithermotolerans]
MNDETTTGYWTVALGAATASGTWDGFRVSPLRRTAELHVDGALTVGEEQRATPGDYALVLSRPGPAGDRVLVAGKGGTVEFGHDVVAMLEGEGGGGALWLTDLSTGAKSELCQLPQVPRTH